MANIPIWPGSSSFAAVSASYYNTPSTGSSPTPFGFYDNDADFKTDANKVANFCARRLGYPIENVELQDLNFWTAFEEATTVYGNELYAYQIRENLLNLEGLPVTTPVLNNTQITPNLGNVIRISEQYGTEAGAGGNVNWYSGSIVLTGSVQDYDLDVWAQQNGISGSDLEIKRVFYQGVPASATYYYGGGMDMGGGGGGGGVIYNNSYTITSGSVINVTVGNGGSGAPAAGTSGQPGSHQYTISATQGGNSVFGSITAIGGGYGGSSYFQYTPNNGYGGSGGSGGGASGYSDGNTGRNGTGSAGQGFNGGASSGQYYSGGGGGAGGSGSSGPNKANGGPGVIYPTMSPYYFG